MIRWSWSFFPALALVLSGCSGSVCKKWENEIESCPDDAFSVEQCEADLENCSSEDEDIIDDTLKCLKDAGAFDECDPDLDVAQLEELAACFDDLGDVSDECLFGGTPPQT